MKLSLALFLVASTSLVMRSDAATCTNVEAVDVEDGTYDITLPKDDCDGFVGATNPNPQPGDGGNIPCKTFIGEWAFDFSFKIDSEIDDPCGQTDDQGNLLGLSMTITPGGDCCAPPGDSCIADAGLCSSFVFDGTEENVCSMYNIGNKKITLTCVKKGVMTVELGDGWPIEVYPNFKGGNTAETVFDTMFEVGSGGSVTGSTVVDGGNTKGISNIEFCGFCPDSSVGGEPHFKTWGQDWFDVSLVLELEQTRLCCTAGS